MSNPDVVIVGAGAAGIGAGQALQAAGVPFVILEAMPRIGGRAFTDRTSLPGHWDQGCQWFHSADINPLVACADRLGSDYERQDRTGNALIWARGRWQSATEVTSMRAAVAAAFDAIYEVGEAGKDVPIAQVIPDGGDNAPFVRHILQLLACDDPENVSTRGYSHYQDTQVNWVVTSGLGDLVARMATGLPIRVGTAVSGISHRPGGVAVDTGAGRIEARAALVTVSTGVLNAGVIAFGPGPAQEMLETIADIPCGSYEKVAVALSALPPGITDELFCWVDPGQGGLPTDFQIVGGAHPKLIAHLAGSLIRDLLAKGEAAAVDFATERLALAFGSESRKLIVQTAMTGWQKNPFVRGGYSYSRPGAADRRLAMIAADTGPIAFAGEAFSARAQATAHGAWQSGQDAARRLVRSQRLG